MRKTIMLVFLSSIFLINLAFAEGVGRYQLLVTEISTPAMTKTGTEMTTERKIIKFDTITGEVWTLDFVAEQMEGKWFLKGKWSSPSSIITPIIERK
jgi:hypothetical protein